MPSRTISYPIGTALIDDRVFATDVINVISISGGKGSLAQWLLALAAGVKIIPAFADTGHEHPLTMEYLDYLESKLGPICRVKADFTARIEGKRRFIAELQLSAGATLRFLHVRRIQPLTDLMVSYDPAGGAGKSVECVFWRDPDTGALTLLSDENGPRKWCNSPWFYFDEWPWRE
ncbi:TPA: phosphoadenosine phosphosulfate reductase family protein [Serratia marcescens]|nr:phosphoadenosine phosphosulfate reductase family protein [Serratia marcescens]HEJ9038107.1 phosphoadenosine phosphosulfate reductase family protein [Serratia marcescens]HEJ9091286.1 phosphoadenosine phosphosulfate reductase family protein [Serratia marcescens]